LRERLAEMRATPSQEPASAPVHEETPIAAEPAPAEPAEQVKMPRFSAYLWRMAVSGRKRK